MANSQIRKRKKVVLSDDELLVKDLMEDFITEKKADGRSEKTLESYRGSFNKFLNYFGENMTIGAITRNSMYKYKGHLVSLEELSVQSVNHYLREIRAFV